jgi:hypothetical protein
MPFQEWNMFCNKLFQIYPYFDYQWLSGILSLVYPWRTLPSQEKLKMTREDTDALRTLAPTQEPGPEDLITVEDVVTPRVSNPHDYINHMFKRL